MKTLTDSLPSPNLSAVNRALSIAVQKQEQELVSQSKKMLQLIASNASLRRALLTAADALEMAGLNESAAEAREAVA